MLCEVCGRRRARVFDVKSRVTCWQCADGRFCVRCEWWVSEGRHVCPATREVERTYEAAHALLVS